jgi:hypothetical protein
MELILSLASFASFVALIAVWVAVPHAGASKGAAEPTPEGHAAQVVAAN